MTSCWRRERAADHHRRVSTSSALSPLSPPCLMSRRPEYAPATAADITQVAARIGWLSDGRWLYPVVPASPAR